MTQQLAPTLWRCLCVILSVVALQRYAACPAVAGTVPGKATSAPKTLEWPLKHSQAVRDFALSRGQDLDKIDSATATEADFFETYQAYVWLYFIYDRTQQKDAAQFITKKTVDFLKGFIAKHPDSAQDTFKAKGLLLTVLGRSDLGGEYLARYRECGLDEFENYRKYYPSTQIDETYIGYVNRLHEVATRNLYSWNPDLKFVRKSLEKVLREVETWQNSYGWAAALSDFRKERLRHHVKYALFSAQDGMCEVEKREKNYAIALQYAEKAKASLREIPTDIPTLPPELRERLTKGLELQIRAIRQLQGAFNDPPSSMTAPPFLFPPAANLTRQNSQIATGTCSTSSCACGCSATTATATVPCCKP